MKGIGLERTKYKNLELVGIYNFAVDLYGFKIELINNIVTGTGILLCVQDDILKYIEKYNSGIIDIDIKNGIVNRCILSNGAAIVRLTDIVTYEIMSKGNLVNNYVNANDVAIMSKEFKNLAKKIPDIFKNTKLNCSQYSIIKRSFTGGVMESRDSRYEKSGCYKNVKSYDLISAHCSNIIDGSFALSKYDKHTEDICEFLEGEGIGLITLINLKIRPGFLGILNKKQVVNYHNEEYSYHNSYIYTAKHITIAVTTDLLKAICYTYTFTEYIISGQIASETGKLPEILRSYVLDKFKDKNKECKGTAKYASAKLIVNLCFGFLCRSTEDFNEYSKSNKLVWPYQWGICVSHKTTLKVAKTQSYLVNKGCKIIAIATDSIKYIGDAEPENVKNELGCWLFEGVMQKYYICTPYRSTALFDDGHLEIKLAGCIEEAAKKYFSTANMGDIIKNGIVIKDGKVNYEYDEKRNKIIITFYDYKMHDY